MIIVKKSHGSTQQLRTDVLDLDFDSIIISDRFCAYMNYKKDRLNGLRKWNLTKGK